MFKLAPLSSRNQFGELLNSRSLFRTAVEIGTHRGEFAHIILQQWHGCKLWCVDPWTVPAGYEAQAELLWGGGTRLDDLAETRIRLAEHSWRVELFRGTSRSATNTVPDCVDFVYVDGDHRRDHVLFDLTQWWTKIRSGGILAGHDWIQPGEQHRWADEIQWAVSEFSSRAGVDVQLVVEEGGLPWSYYMEKP